jgi:hypothetical protein
MISISVRMASSRASAALDVCEVELSWQVAAIERPLAFIYLLATLL